MNPKTDLPQFTEIYTNEVKTKLEETLQHNLQEINKLLDNKNFTWENLMDPIEALSDQLSNQWSPVSHMNSVVNTDELREAYNACLPKLTQYSMSLSQNPELYKAVQTLADSETFYTYTEAQQRIIENELRDFKLSGISLPKEKQKQFAKLAEELSQLTSKFEENVLDATHAWTYQVTDKSELSGLPEHAIAMAKQAAKEKNEEGYLLTLEAPCYIAVMTYADSKPLRKKMYHAFTTRASEEGPNAGEFDNTTIMHDILTKRLELARLLDFNNFAEYSLETKMVHDTKKVLEFLNQLAEKTHEKAKEEYKQLCKYAKEQFEIDTLNAWDIGYYSEKLRQHEYAISQEDLRPYFPEQKVLEGFFTILNKLYNITVKPLEGINTWHKDAKCFGIYDNNDELTSLFYLDLYARPKKRGGAWMDECRVRRKLDNGDVQIPAAYITCNFNSPIGNDPALFTHDEVITLFHEMGHGLQHMLTQIDYADVSGINGIPWDAVEVASQFMENWAWEKESLDLIAEHYQTGEKLPEDLFQRMIRAKNFQSALQMIRQLEFSLFDFELHMNFDPKKQNQVQEVLNAVRERVSVIQPPDFNRFQHGFSHIFAGGYAAGYYSYKWAEVMACDAFSLFKEKGIFDAETSQKFLNTFLAYGGAKDPLDVFVEFRGREPDVNALLQQTGIVE